VIDIDSNKCSEVGELLKQKSIRSVFYNRSFLKFEADRETKLRVYFLSVAICHQTHNLHNKGKNLWGWDYLEYGFLKWVSEKNPLLNPGYVNVCNKEELKSLLLKTF